MNHCRRKFNRRKTFKRSQLKFECLEPRMVFALGGLTTPDPNFKQNPAQYFQFQGTNMPILHSNPNADAALMMYFEGGIQENGFYWEPSDYETKGISTQSLAMATGTNILIPVTKENAGDPAMSFAQGHRIHIHSTLSNGPDGTASTNYMSGVVESFNGTQLRVTIDTVHGSGTFNSWKITNVHFNTAEQEMIVDLWYKTARQFAIFNIDVTTDFNVFSSGKPFSFAGVRRIGNGGSIMSTINTGKTDISINATDQPRTAGWVLPHEFAHTLTVQHQSSWNDVGLLSADYAEAYNRYYYHMMGNRVDDNTNPHMPKWSIGQVPTSATTIQGDLEKIMGGLIAVGVSAFRKTAEAEPSFVPDYSSTTATPLTDLGDNDYAITGIINSISDYDKFSFTPTSSGYYDVMVGHDGSTIDLSMELYDASIKIYAAEDDRHSS